MADRATIKKQIEFVQALLIESINDLTIANRAIEQEPMGFHLSSVDRLRMLSGAAENLALTMQQTYEMQHLEAQNLALRATLHKGRKP